MDVASAEMALRAAEDAVIEALKEMKPSPEEEDARFAGFNQKITDSLHCRDPEPEKRFDEWLEKYSDDADTIKEDTSLWWNTFKMKEIYIENYNGIKAVPFHGASLPGEEPK